MFRGMSRGEKSLMLGTAGVQVRLGLSEAFRRLALWVQD